MLGLFAWNRRGLGLRVLGLCTAGLLLFAGSSVQATPPEPDDGDRPNIVIIMADDMGFSDIGCYGGEINTPNLDALAAQGLRFTQFYNTARCCPTRAALLTGLYPHQAGVGHMTGDYGYPAYQGGLNRSCVTIAEALGEAGYTTLMSGKWHASRPSEKEENGPIARGFDRYYGILHGAASFFDPITLTLDEQPTEPEGEDYYFTDAVSEYAAQFIDEAAENDDRPFFLYVAYTAPHWPLHALPEDIAKYEDRYDEGWDQLRAERHERMIEMGLVDESWPLSPRDPNEPVWSDAPNNDWHARRMAVYAAQVDRMDQGIGQIIQRLKDRDLLDNTLILFLADNGGCAEEIGQTWGGLHIPEKTRDGRPVQVGNNPEVMPGPEDTYQSYGRPWANASNTPFRLYKHWVHEGGIATPLIAHWPSGIPKSQHGELTDEPGHVIDLMTTCLDVAEADYPEQYQGHTITSLEGKSLRPVWETGSRDGHEAIFWEHEGNRAVRQGRWKLVSRYRGPWELYNLRADRTELNNLADQYPEKVAKLSDLYEDWAKRAKVVPWSQLR